MATSLLILLADFTLTGASFYFHYGLIHLGGYSFIQVRTPYQGWLILPIGHFQNNGAEPLSHSHQEVYWTLGRMYWRTIKNTYKLVSFPVPLLDSILLPVFQLPPRVGLSCVLLESPYLSFSHPNIQQMTFFFRHLRKSTHISSNDLFILCGNTRGYTSITHWYHRSVWTPASLVLVDQFSLTMVDYPLLVSGDVPTDYIPRSAGTASESGRTSWINMDPRKTSQGIVLG